MQDKDQKLQKTEEYQQPTTSPMEKTPGKSPIRNPQSLGVVIQENVEASSNPAALAAPKAAGNLTPNTETSRATEEISVSSTKVIEDPDHEKRPHIPRADYHAMSMEKLVDELQRLIKHENIQALGKQVSVIKHEFDQKFQAFIKHKKEEFVADDGSEVDFRYNSVVKKQFDEIFAEYREKRNQYYEKQEQTLKSNLQKRLALIEQLKSFINVKEDIHTTYEAFKELQEKWRNAGSVPRNHYNHLWQTYHHHVETFYDFLQLNRELRDLDFKHNLEEKLKLIARAEVLIHEPDLYKALKELQALHKIWKEDIGPVAKEHREAVWEQFSKATKALYQRRQDELQEMEKDYEKNLEKKREIITSLKALANTVSNNYKALQHQIKQVEVLREAFFKAGKVSRKDREQSWTDFKEAIREFNNHKNTFYKTLKKEQQQNLEKKKALVAIAISLKDSEDWNKATPEMKRIQSEWKKIGFVPRKEADTLWQEFKAICNHYFDRLHAKKNEEQKEEHQNFEKKTACLEQLKNFQLSGDTEKDVATIKKILEEWKQYGRIPYDKKHINTKFNKIVDALFKKTGISQQQSELLKYGNKVQQLAHTNDPQALNNEQTFIKRKIAESKAEIRQLENNLEFFSSTSENNPLVKNVVNHIEQQKETLETWKTKLKKLHSLENHHHKTNEKDPDKKA